MSRRLPPDAVPVVWHLELTEGGAIDGHFYDASIAATLAGGACLTDRPPTPLPSPSLVVPAGTIKQKAEICRWLFNRYTADLMSILTPGGSFGLVSFFYSGGSKGRGLSMADII